MITKFKIFENIRWYSKGKLSDPELDIEKKDEDMTYYSMSDYEKGRKGEGGVNLKIGDRIICDFVNSRGKSYENMKATVKMSTGVLGLLFDDDMGGHNAYTMQDKQRSWNFSVGDSYGLKFRLI